MATSDLTTLEMLLQDWRELLSLWAQNGTLTRAAQEALQLEGEPEKLRELVGEWSQGDFRNLPPVVLLPASAMPGAAGAYAISTGTIYLNQDWLKIVSWEQATAILTEELGHHLDGMFNSMDTPGDEGELFAIRLHRLGLNAEQYTRLMVENDFFFTMGGDGLLSLEASALWTRPVASNVPVVATFYERFADYNGDRILDQHNGLDFDAAIGAPIYASRSGLVRIRPFMANGYGNYIDIDHGDGFISRYAHLDRFSVANGSNVTQGQKIGEMGNTGFVIKGPGGDGSHLHFEIRNNNVPLDPLPLITGSAPPLNPPPPAATDARLVLPIFDPAYYLATYTDVRNAYGASNHDGASSHWLQFGINEGRRGSLVFDPKDYLQRYQDVANAYGTTNYAGAISHWLEWGLKYGRRGSQEFDPIYYMAAHPDVEAAYGVMNFSGAISHYYQWGKPGGWYGSEWITDQNAFQLWYYLNNNADVKAVTANANQEVEATRHWYFIGINEGRRGSAKLDSKFYLANNPDVRAAYGDGNYRGAIDHYLLFGKQAGRTGANDTPRTLSISDANASEGNNGIREISFVVSLNIVSGETVAVNFNTSNGTAASGSDYSASSGSLSFAPGETSKTVVVQINGDSTHEGDETLYVNLSGASNAAISRSQAVGTILNDDPANNTPTALGISVNSFNENIAAGSTVANLTTTDPDAGNTFSYSLVSGIGDTDNNAFSIAGNQLSIKSSPDFEAKSSYSIRVRSTDQGGLSFERAVIFNVIDVNEPVITLSISPTSVTEDGTSNLVYTFSRTGATTTALTVNYTVGGTATLGTDYTGIAATPAVKTVIFAANSSTAKVTVDPTADTTIEANETVALTLATGTGYSISSTAAVVGTIINDDIPTTTTAITAVNDNVGLIQGVVAAGARTDDTTPTITGTISAALAAGETLRIFNGATLLGSATVNNTNRTWSYIPTLPASAGTTYNITARVADAAGNLGTASAVRSFIVDTTAPATAAAITRVSDNVGLIKGNVAAAGRTDDRTPTITGTIGAALAAGETLRIFNGNTLLGSATVNNTNRTWSYTPTLPASAGTTYNITARVADAAGNLGTASVARSFVLDTTAPSVAAFSPLDGAIGVDPAANILLTFRETIQRGTGTIQLRVGSATGPITESFEAATSNRLSLSGGRLTINPTSNLAPNTRYFLTLPAGSITDQVGNPFAGTSTYDFRSANVVSGGPANDILSFSATVDRLTGLGGVDTFRLTSLSHSRLPASPTTPIDRITDLVTGVDRIDAPVVRNLAQALNPVARGSISQLSASAITALLTPANFPALTATSTGGVASFSFNDPANGVRTFLAINDDIAGFSAASDAIIEITGFTGNLSQLQVF